MVPPCRQGLRGQRGWSHLGGAVNCPNFSRGLTPWPLGVSPSHSAPVQHILLCAHPSVCLSPLLQTPSQFSDPSVCPSPQVTLPCIWRPSTATPSASANCCRYRGWEGLFCPWTPFPPQWWWLARWFLALPGTCSALHHAKKHVYLSVPCPLPQASCPVDVADSSGRTALHHAGEWGRCQPCAARVPVAGSMFSLCPSPQRSAAASPARRSSVISRLP